MKRKEPAVEKAEGKKKACGHAGKYDVQKRGPPSSRLHINEPRALRGYAMVSCTYDGGKDASAIAELHRLFEDHIEIVHGSIAATTNRSEAKVDPSGNDKGGSRDSTTAALTASDLMQKELDALNADKDSKNGAMASSLDSTSHSRRLMTVRTNCKGVAMLRVGSQRTTFESTNKTSEKAHECGKNGTEVNKNGDEDERHRPISIVVAEDAHAVDVVRVARSIFQTVASTRKPCCRHVIRLVPLQWTCFAGLPEVFALLHMILLPHFHGPGVQPGTFMVAMKRRNNQDLDRDAVVGKIVELVGPHHSVCLKNPRRVVVVEVIQALCGISVISDHEYSSFAEFNLRKFQAEIDAGASTSGEDCNAKPK